MDSRRTANDNDGQPSMDSQRQLRAGTLYRLARQHAAAAVLLSLSLATALASHVAAERRLHHAHVSAVLR